MPEVTALRPPRAAIPGMAALAVALFAAAGDPPSAKAPAVAGRPMPAATSDAAKASAADLPPEEVLRRRGLTREGRCFVLASEAEAGKTLAAIPPAFEARQAVLGAIADAASVDARIAELAARRVALQDRIQALAHEMTLLPRRTVNEKQQHRLMTEQQVGLREDLRQVTTEAKTLTPTAAGAKGWQALRSRFDEADRACRAAVGEARSAVDSVAGQYRSLAGDAEVAAALKALPKPDRGAALKLGPSDDFRRVVQRLARVEKEEAASRPKFPGAAKAPATARKKASGEGVKKSSGDPN